MLTHRRKKQYSDWKNCQKTRDNMGQARIPTQLCLTHTLTSLPALGPLTIHTHTSQHP